MIFDRSFQWNAPIPLCLCCNRFLQKSFFFSRLFSNAIRGSPILLLQFHAFCSHCVSLFFLQHSILLFFLFLPHSFIGYVMLACCLGSPHDFFCTEHGTIFLLCSDLNASIVSALLGPQDLRLLTGK